MYKELFQQGVRLRLMCTLLAVFAFVFAASIGFYGVSTMFLARDKTHTDALKEYEYNVELYDGWVEAYGIEEVLSQVGARPEHPELPAIVYTELFVCVAVIFVILMFTVFMCSVLYFFSNSSLCLYKHFSATQGLDEDGPECQG